MNTHKKLQNTDIDTGHKKSKQNSKYHHRTHKITKNTEHRTEFITQNAERRKQKTKHRKSNTVNLVFTSLDAS